MHFIFAADGQVNDSFMLRTFINVHTFEKDDDNFPCSNFQLA